jgi:hypothetical protein
MGPRFEGMACVDWSCFKMRCPHLDRSQIRFWATHLKLCFCDSEGAASDSKRWCRVAEPCKSDSCANAVTRVRSKEHSIEGCDEGVDAARVHDAHTALSGWAFGGGADAVYLSLPRIECRSLNVAQSATPESEAAILGRRNASYQVADASFEVKMLHLKLS